jgi:hypothetical protein
MNGSTPPFWAIQVLQVPPPRLRSRVLISLFLAMNPGSFSMLYITSCIASIIYLTPHSHGWYHLGWIWLPLAGNVPVGSKPFNTLLREAVGDIVTEFLRPIRKCRAVEE